MIALESLGFALFWELKSKARVGNLFLAQLKGFHCVAIEQIPRKR